MSPPRAGFAVTPGGNAGRPAKPDRRRSGLDFPSLALF